MASVNWMKLQGGSMGAIVGHATRHDMRDGVKYSNADIDTSRRTENYTIGQAPMSTRAVLGRLKTRVCELDKEHPPKRLRKDRVVGVAFELTAPRGLRKSDEKRFFRMAWEELAKTCGGTSNLSAGWVHNDEVHAYRDAMTGKQVMSLAHMHCVGIPWTSEHGVNGKHFMTRERMKDLNRRIDERCMALFNVHYLAGEAERTGRDVADLKRESFRQEVTDLETEFCDVSRQLYQVRDDLEKAREDLDWYRYMKDWMKAHYFIRNKGEVTEHHETFYNQCKKDFKKRTRDLHKTPEGPADR